MESLCIFASFINLLSGICIFVRICSQLEKNRLISPQQSTNFGIIFVCAILILCVWVPFSSIVGFFLLHLLLFAVFISGKLLKKLREREFYKQIPGILRKISLRMQVGHSFRESLQIVCSENTPYVCWHLQQAHSFVVFSQQSSSSNTPSFMEKLVHEFKKIDHSTQNARQLVDELCEKLQIEHDFRHRSGQVLSGARIQGYVMIGIYFASLIYTINFFGLKKNLEIILLSSVLFFVGSVWMFNLGRSIRWRL